MINLYKKIIRLYKKNEEIINYLIVGGLTTVVSLGTYYILVLTYLNPNDPVELQITNIIAWVMAVTFAYFTNSKYVFKSNKRSLKEGISFYLSRVSTLLIDMGIMLVFVTLLGFNDKIIKIVIQIIIVILNYVISKFFVFRKD